MDSKLQSSADVASLGIPLTDAEKRAFDRALRNPGKAAVSGVDLGPKRQAMVVVEDAAARLEGDRKVQANERVRSTAGFVNGIASTVLTAGVITPGAGAFFPKSPFADHVAPLYGLAAACVVCAALLHAVNRVLLDGLRA